MIILKKGWYLMGKPVIYITRKLPESSIQPLKDFVEIKMWPHEEEPIPQALLLKEVAHVDGLISMLSDKIDAEVFDHAPSLKIVANLAVGYDNIDIKEAEKRGVFVSNTPDVLTETTADLTFGLLMATARRIVEAAEFLKEGKWQNWGPMLLAGRDLYKKSIGIVGMGRIGEAVAKRTIGFDMPLYYHNRTRKLDAEEQYNATYLPFEDLLQTCDYIVCLTPLTNETKLLFDEHAFKLMKKEAIFINAARGAVVDEDALVRALEQGEIAGAGLDVFKQEPISKDHPLLQFPQVVALPHIGSSSIDTRLAMVELACENIKQVLGNGKAPVTLIPELS